MEDFVDDEPLFRFDNDEDTAAMMDHMLATGDMDRDIEADPVTPYGSAGPSASPAAASTGSASGKLHLSSAKIWQNPDPNPETASSPPPLTYSPSPRTPSSFKHRHQDSSSRPQRQRFSSRRNSTQHQYQQSSSRQDSAQGPEHNVNGPPSPAADLTFEQYYEQQIPDDRAHPPRRSHGKDQGKAARKVQNKPKHGYEEQVDGRSSLQHPSCVAHPRHVGSASRQGHVDSDPATSHGLHQVDQYMRLQQPPYGAEPQQDGPSTNLMDREEPDMQFVEPADCQEYELIPADEVHEMMYNGDEESRITAQKLKEQVVNAVTENGKVCYMVLQATAQWWRSPEMAKRKRAAGRKVYDVSSQVVSGAGHVILTSTPVGRICESVSANVNAFRAAPFTYTMQGLGVMKKDPGTISPLPSAGANGLGHPAEESETGPAIADGDGFGSEFDEDASMGLDMFDDEQ